MTNETNTNDGINDGAIEDGKDYRESIDYILRHMGKKAEALRHSFDNAVKEAKAKGNEDAATRLSSALVACNQIVTGLEVLTGTIDSHRGAVVALCSIVRGQMAIMDKHGIKIEFTLMRQDDEGDDGMDLSVDSVLTHAEDLVGVGAGEIRIERRDSADKAN